MKYILTAVVGMVILAGVYLVSMNTLEAPDVVEETEDEQQDTQDDVPNDALIRIASPQPGEAVGNPAKVSGEARGYWFFEASAPVVVTDWDGRIIGEGYVTAEGEWMTEDFVPFSGSIEYTLPAESYSANGTIIFMRDNPSGLPENDAAVEVPVVLTPGV